MSYVTNHLDEESGVQYLGVQDKTNINQIGDMSNMLMLIEDVPRGRLDREMTVTKANKYAVLGREKGNLYLQAVEDALEAGADSIKVLRVCSNENPIIEPIGCTGALSYLPLSGQGTELSLLFIVNDQIAGRIDGGLNIFAINEILSPYGLCFIDSVGIVNLSNQFVRLKVIAGSFDENTNETLGYYNFWTLPTLENPTVSVTQILPDYDEPISVEPEIYNEDTHTPMYAETSACLAPSNTAISCDGATDNVGFTISFPLTDNFTPIYDDPFGYIGVNDFKVDGVNVPTNSLPFSLDVVLLYNGSENISEQANGARVKLINDIGPNKRIEFSRPQGLYFDWDSNPTLQWDENTNLVTCCLAHSVPAPNQISCDGATPEIGILFEYLSMHTPDVLWRIEIYDATTGLLYSSCTNNDIDENSPNLAETLNINKQNEALTYSLSVENDALIIKNTTSDNIRLKVIAKGHSDDGAYGIEITDIESSNPTAFFVKNIQYDYDLRVCLSPLDESLDIYTPAVLALNPKAYYLMNEESGNIVNDYSDSEFHGEIRHIEDISYKQPSIRKGSTGALGFNIGTNGSSGLAECFVSDTVAGDFFRKLAGNEKSCTIAFWCKPISVKQYTYLATYILNSAMGYNNYRFIAYGSDKLLVQSPGNDNQVASTNSFTEMINQSNFIVWRKDAVAQTYTLTVNGVSKTVSGESSPEAAGQGFFFPMSDGYSSYGLRGFMSDMSVFDYALTDAQVGELYTKGKLD